MEIAFQEGSRIDANPSGDWSPRPGGANGSAPADFGAKATVLIATAEAAARNIEFNLSSNSIELGADGNSFPVDGITVGIPEESEAAVDLAVGGFLPVNTSQSLAGLSGENASSENATMTLVDNIQTLTIPIQTEVGFRVVSPNDALLTFTGNIVATRELPEPTEPPVIVDPIPVPPIPVPPLPPVPPVVEVPDTAPTLAIGLSASGEFELRWDAVEGRSYRIEQSGNLSDWASVGDPVTADSGDGVWTSAGAEGSLFYRILLLPAN